MNLYSAFSALLLRGYNCMRESVSYACRGDDFGFQVIVTVAVLRHGDLFRLSRPPDEERVLIKGPKAMVIPPQISHRRLLLGISYRQSDWLLSSLQRLCSSLLPLISSLEYCTSTSTIHREGSLPILGYYASYPACPARTCLGKST
jgi:hypothetical protein